MARAIGEAARLVLKAVAEAPGAATATVASLTGLSTRQVSDAAGKLAAAGWIERGTRAGFYKETEAGREALTSGATLTSGPKGPTGAKRRLKDTFRTRAWKSMRIRKLFTPAEVAMDAARDERDPADDAYRYILRLVEAGHVVPVVAPEEQGRRRGKGRAQRYRLVKDLGPVAPVFSRVKGLVQDFNLRTEDKR